MTPGGRAFAVPVGRMDKAQFLHTGYEDMDNFYVACELGVEQGRVALGTLRQGRLTVSEVRRFQNVPVEEKSARVWNIPQLYAEILTGLREVGTYEEPISSVSCFSWGGDYLLFDADGTLNTPVYHPTDAQAEAAMDEVLAKIPWETIYDETGTHRQPGQTLFQLAAEKSRRLHHAAHLLPVADGLNYLLSGTPRVEMSSAGATQLFNPLTGTWSGRLLDAARLPAKLFPEVVPAGAKLGVLREAIAADAKLESTRVIAAGSHELAAALAGLPVGENDCWAFLRHGPRTLIGTGLVRPIISADARESQFTNQIGCAGAVAFHKPVMGLWVLEECERFWREHDRDLDRRMLLHFAGDAPPFESLVDLADPRFLAPGDLPQKIQSFCRDTNQTVPRKPGSIARCILESLALLYRKTLREIESLTGRDITALYVLDGQEHSLLNHFTANALQLPLVIVPPGSAVAGNLIGQALAQGHVKSVAVAREILRNSIKTKTIAPHANAWSEACSRLTELAA